MLTFIVTSLVIAAIPGTGAIYTLSEAIGRGRRPALVAAFGCTLGILPHLTLAVTGLASVLQASPTAFEVIKYAGVAYLLYIALMTWRDRTDIGVDNVETMSDLKVIRHAIVINLLNPKLTIFFFAFLPQFTGGSGNQFIHMIGLGLAFMVITFVVFAAYGLLAASIRNHIVGQPRNVIGFRRAFAVTFVALSIKLATT